jgi:Thioredoxin like C-terminal domain
MWTKLGALQNRRVQVRFLSHLPQTRAYGVIARGEIGGQRNGDSATKPAGQLIRQLGPIVDRTFEIEFLDAGVEAFAFTFG